MVSHAGHSSGMANIVFGDMDVIELTMYATYANIAV
jgi:hypothetical protein